MMGPGHEARDDVIAGTTALPIAPLAREELPLLTLPRQRRAQRAHEALHAVVKRDEGAELHDLRLREVRLQLGVECGMWDACFNLGSVPHRIKEVIRVQLSRAAACSY